MSVIEDMTARHLGTVRETLLEADLKTAELANHTSEAVIHAAIAGLGRWGRNLVEASHGHERLKLVRAVEPDLKGAQACGLATCFVPRPTEYGPLQSRDFKADGDWTLVSSRGRFAETVCWTMSCSGCSIIAPLPRVPIEAGRDETGHDHQDERDRDQGERRPPRPRFRAGVR